VSLSLLPSSAALASIDDTDCGRSFICSSVCCHGVDRRWAMSVIRIAPGWVTVVPNLRGVRHAIECQRGVGGLRALCDEEEYMHDLVHSGVIATERIDV